MQLGSPFKKETCHSDARMQLADRPSHVLPQAFPQPLCGGHTLPSRAQPVAAHPEIHRPCLPCTTRDSSTGQPLLQKPPRAGRDFVPALLFPSPWAQSSLFVFYRHSPPPAHSLPPLLTSSQGLRNKALSAHIWSRAPSLFPGTISISTLATSLQFSLSHRWLLIFPMGEKRTWHHLPFLCHLTRKPWDH